MGNVWFTSDLHIGHTKVAALRGYSSVQDHDTAIVDHWWSKVGKRDQVWILGDLAVSSPRHVLTLLDLLPGEKHLIAGNHDYCHPMYRDAHKRQRQYLETFASVQAFARRKVADKHLLLSHFPYSLDHTFTPRFNQWRLRDDGLWLMHGHTHGPERVHGHELHVGWDAWGRFLPLNEIEELISDDSQVQETSLSGRDQGEASAG